VELGQGLKPWRQERIIRIALRARKLDKGSCPYVFYLRLNLYWMIIGLNV